MAVNLLSNDDGSLGLQGRDFDAGEFIGMSAEWTPSSADMTLGILTRSMRVKAIRARVTTVGTDAGAVTAVIRKVNNSQAITAGTALHSGTINLKGTIDLNQDLVLASATDGTLDLVDGHTLAIDFTGVLTAAVGTVTVWLSPR